MNCKNYLRSQTRSDISTKIIDSLKLKAKDVSKEGYYPFMSELSDKILTIIERRFNITMKPRGPLIEMDLIILGEKFHGSGVDSDWAITESNKNWTMSNSFHCMDEHGYYCGWQDFSIVIPKRCPEDFKLHFNGDQYLARKHMLRDYMEDTFSHILDEHLKKTKK